MPERYAAFLSYAHRYRPWVENLQKNLEAGLAAAGRPGKVFLDEVDLASGRTWVGQLQAGLARSEQLVLVVTPEALASPRVTDEWEGFVARNRDWQSHCHIALLVETPLPPFLTPLQAVDFHEADEAKYRHAFQVLLAGLLRRDPRNLPALPAGFEIPAPPDPALPAALRRQLVTWLVPLLAKKPLRLAVASSLGLDRAVLEGPSPESAASAALVLATGDEVPEIGALRIVDSLADTFGDDGEPARTSELQALRAEFLKLQRSAPEHGLLSIWLHQVAADHAQLVPYFQRQAEIDLLERVYVQLELRPERETSPEPGQGVLDRPLGLRQVLALSCADAPWITGRWVVLGDPGSGKTTLLRHLSATLAQENLRPWVPLYESLPRLLREGRSLLDRVVRRLELAGHPAQGLKAALDREGQDGRLLLLLDGLDEVPREEREEAEQLLRALAVRWPATPLVVTSRPIGYRRPASDFRELTLLPLDATHRLELLARWLGAGSGVPDETAARRALATLDTPELRELAGNPLYLTLMALLLKGGQTPERNRTRLYDQVFELLFEEGYRWTRTEPLEHQQAVHEILGRVALGMTEDNRDAESVTALEARLYQPDLDRLRDTLERVPRWRGRMRQLLDDVAERTGILGPHDEKDADWRFWHRTFREALASEQLAEEYRGKEGWEALLSRVHAITAEEDQSRWAEPFALLAGRVEDPDGLVRALVKANRPLGLRALATAQNLRDKTLREVLTLTENWEERRKVYARVPDLVGEPGRALRLLDQLRRRTRDGNDLFFLDEAVQEVGQRSPEHAREAAELRVRFYDHIPAPRERLFRWIDTPIDGRVDLWREIPAGQFWMGSPKGKGHEDEHPRHKVTIARPFRFAVVPVTRTQYAAFDNRRQFQKWEGVTAKELPHHPVIGVNWYEAVSFCRWLSVLFPWARGARLPVEEEWEYACRAGTESPYWSGAGEEDLARVDWYRSNSGDRTHRVGEKPANPWGLYDVHGNVFEWTLSPWTRSYDGREVGVALDPSAVEEPTAVEAISGDARVIRGGSRSVDTVGARAAFRYRWDPRFAHVDQGFRVILPAGPELLTVEAAAAAC